jgi:hypothetical protein
MAEGKLLWVWRGAVGVDLQVGNTFGTVLGEWKAAAAGTALGDGMDAF